jgi:probable HAF family extracellular repeat protein
MIGVLVTLGLLGCGSEETSPSLVTTAPDAVTTARGIPVTVVVLGNDRDTQDLPLAVVGVTQGAHGTVVRNVDHTVTYTPNAGFDGTDSFTYTVRNAQGESDTNVVTVTILPADGLVLRGTLSTITPIDFPRQVFTVAVGINDAGQIVGTGACLDPCGYVLDQGSFSSVPGFTSRPNGLNNLDQVVGLASFDTSGRSPCLFNGEPVITNSFLWDRRTGSVTIIEIPGSSNRQLGLFCRINSTVAQGINDMGQIVGSFLDTNNVRHGFLWQAGTFTQIDVPGAISTEARGINNSSQIVGVFVDASGLSHGFLRDGDTFTRIDVPDATSTEANGINNSSQIVGAFAVPEAPPETGRITRGYVTTPVNSGPLARFGVPAVQ